MQQVRVIDEDGQQLGIYLTSEAIRLAHDKSMDLIEIVPKASPPVCKIMDFGKYRYEQSKREKMQKKHQVTTQVKEIRFQSSADGRSPTRTTEGSCWTASRSVSRILRRWKWRRRWRGGRWCASIPPTGRKRK